MRVFVTDGTGTIGLAVVRELAERGHEVIGLARSSSSAAALEAVGASALAGHIHERRENPPRARLASVQLDPLADLLLPQS